VGGGGGGDLQISGMANDIPEAIQLNDDGWQVEVATVVGL